MGQPMESRRVGSIGGRLTAPRTGNGRAKEGSPCQYMSASSYLRLPLDGPKASRTGTTPSPLRGSTPDGSEAKQQSRIERQSGHVGLILSRV